MNSPETNSSTETNFPTLEELEAVVREQEKEIEQLTQEQDEKMRILNDIDAIYDHIKIDVKAIATPEPQQQSLEQSNNSQQNQVPVSALGSALSQLLSSKRKKEGVKSPLMSPIDNLEEVAKRQETVAGRNKVKSLANDTNKQLDSLLNESLTSEEAEIIVNKIKNNITEINQDIHLNLKATQHKNGTELEKAMSKMKSDVGHLGKLSERIQKDSSALDIRNKILPDSGKVDFAALSGSIRDSANKMTTLLKVFSKKLDTSTLQVS